MRRILLTITILVFELRKILSGSYKCSRAKYAVELTKQKKIPYGKSLVIYAISASEGERNSECLVALIPHVKRYGKSRLVNSATVMHLAEAALLECDLSAYKSVEEYIDVKQKPKDRRVQALDALNKYYAWLTRMSPPPEVDGIYEGFFLFKTQIELMRAVHYLYTNERDKFQKSLARAALLAPKEAQLSHRIKLIQEYSDSNMIDMPTIKNVILGN